MIKLKRLAANDKDPEWRKASEVRAIAVREDNKAKASEAGWREGLKVGDDVVICVGFGEHDSHHLTTVVGASGSTVTVKSSDVLRGLVKYSRQTGDSSLHPKGKTELRREPR